MTKHFKTQIVLLMTYDISEIKKLSSKEKLQIIDEIWETIENDEQNGEETFDEEPEVVAMLEERIAKYERGEGVSYTWDEAKSKLLSNLKDIQNGK